MEQSVYEGRVKEIMAEIQQTIETKGISSDSISEETGIPAEQLTQILSGDTIPSLTQFLALCEISGMTISLPFVETPRNPM